MIILIASVGCQKVRVDPGCIEKPSNRCCYRIYTPVCGCNGKTYSNDCEAEGHGITWYTKGECKSG
ncbi:protease inhibitor Kazal-type [Persicitalea jodogahamensis]|uniref:protease inhibitor Kazal-type n=1 Tax=Persicitalea jodogahamensis TaxID=402147 RepID=UPI001E50F5DF|nr:protease inhibitor Kazal-type [Persicitalea jodogahamensis]